MGSGNAKLSKTEERLVDQNNYLRDRDIPEDERYGKNVRVYKETTSPNCVAIVEKVFDSEIPFLAVYEIQKQMQLLQHPGLLQILNVETKTKSTFCSKHFKLKMLYEYVDRDLKENISQRVSCQAELDSLKNQEVSAFFEEGELWYILATVGAVLAYLQQQGVVHGDIRPSSLFLTKEGGLKIVGVNSFIQCGWSSYLEKIEGMETTSTYISPIQLSALQHKIRSPVHNVPKSDLFALAVILLECATLQSAQEIYNLETYTIDSSRFIQQLYDSQRYSDMFISTLIDLLQIDEDTRLNPEQLYERIAQLAQEEQITISPKIDSLEKAQLIVTKNRPQLEAKLSVKGPENLILIPDGFQIPDDFQKALVLLPSSKATQFNNSPESGQKQSQQDPLLLQQQQQQAQEQETEEELPNQEDGEVLEESYLRQQQQQQQQQQHNESNHSVLSLLKNTGLVGPEDLKNDASGLADNKPKARRQLSEGKDLPNPWSALKNVMHTQNEQQTQQQQQQLNNNEINNALQGNSFHLRSQSQHSMNAQPQQSMQVLQQFQQQPQQQQQAQLGAGGLGGLGRNNGIGRIALLTQKMHHLQMQKQRQQEFLQQQQEILQQQQLQELLIQQEMGNQNHNLLQQNPQQMFTNNNNNFFGQNQMGNNNNINQAQMNQALLQNMMGSFGGQQNFNMNNNNGMFDQGNSFNSPQKNAILAQLQQQLRLNQLAGNSQSPGAFQSPNMQGFNGFQQQGQLQGLQGLLGNNINNNNNINHNGFNGLSLGYDSNQFNSLNNNNNFISPTFNNNNNNSIQGMSGMSGHFGGGNSNNSSGGGSSNVFANRLMQALNSGGKSTNFLSNNIQNNNNNNNIQGNGLFPQNNNNNNSNPSFPGQQNQDGFLNKLAGVFGNSNNNNNNSNNNNNNILNNNANPLGQNAQVRAPIF